MSQPLVITLAERGNPRHILGYFDASRAHFSTDPRLAIKFEDLGAACAALGHLRNSHPAQAEWISVRSEPQAQPRTKALAWGWFGAGLVLASLAGCAHTPRSAADCGRHFQGGSGLLGLAGSMGAFDREPGPDCSLRGYAVNSSGYIPPNDVQMPPDPDPLPLSDNRSRFLIPGGSGTLMEIGGDTPGLMVPAGSGTFMAMP